MEGSTIVYAELDLDRIGPEQQALDAVGHYNRPDVFRLLVDESAREPLAYGPFAGPS
jgi:nitrilase